MGLQEVTWVSVGVAWRIRDSIYIHHSLKDKPDLLKEVMTHELEHDESYGFTVKDFTHDLNTKLSWKLRRHIYLHPSMWVSALPVSIRCGKIHINPFMCWLWSFCILGYCLIEVLV
jgi:hypothetical protein